MNSDMRYMQYALKCYEGRRKVLQVDWKLLIGAILIMGFSIFAGMYLKENIINEDLGTILLMGVPLIGGSFTGRILAYTFSIGWSKKKSRKYLRKHPEEDTQ